MKLALLAAAATILAASTATAPLATGNIVGQATGPAAARSPVVVLHDGPGDVWTYSDTTLGYQPAVQPAVDVLKARVVHGPYGVRVRMVYDDLQKVDTQWYRCDIRTAGVTSRFVLEARKGHWRGKAWQEIQGEWVRVTGLSHRIDYTSDVVTLRVARKLLGDPAWVRVRLLNDLGQTDGNTFFTDNPTTALPDAVFTARLPHR